MSLGDCSMGKEQIVWPFMKGYITSGIALPTCLVVSLFFHQTCINFVSTWLQISHRLSE